MLRLSRISGGGTSTSSGGGYYSSTVPSTFVSRTSLQPYAFTSCSKQHVPFGLSFVVSRCSLSQEQFIRSCSTRLQLAVQRTESERRMERAVNLKDWRQAQSIFASLIEERKKVTEFHYRCLIESYSIYGKLDEALRVFEEMQAQGIYPNRLHIGSLIRACKKGNVDKAFEIYERSKTEFRLEPTANTFSSLISVCSVNRNLDRAISLFDEMKQLGIAPLKTSYISIIFACLHDFQSQRAIDILKGLETKLGMRLEFPDLLFLLNGCLKAEDSKAASYVFSLLRQRTPPSRYLEEGILLSLLTLAARGRDVPFAEEIWKLAKQQHAIPSALLYGALIQAYGNMRMLKQAFQALQERIDLGFRTTPPVFRTMVNFCTGSPKQLDTAYQSLEELYNEGYKLEITCFSILIQACAQTRDLSRALTFFKKLPQFNLKPDIHIFNSLFEILLQEMKRHSIEPTEETYQKMIETYCLAGDKERALNVLELMAKEGKDIIRPHLHPLGVLYIRQKEWDKVDRVIRQIQDLGDNPNRLVYLTKLKREGQVEMPLDDRDKDEE